MDGKRGQAKASPDLAPVFRMLDSGGQTYCVEGIWFRLRIDQVDTLSEAFRMRSIRCRSRT
jgi:hypothetical protein